MTQSLRHCCPLLERDVKAHFHCHRADDICTAIRIAREFNLDYVIIHGTEGHLIADILAEENAKVIAGPILCDRCKPEMQNLTISGPSVMQKAGVKLALCTDHPVIPIQYLPTTAALAVKGGMKREDASMPSLPAQRRSWAWKTVWAALRRAWTQIYSCTTATRWTCCATRGWC